MCVEGPRACATCSHYHREASHESQADARWRVRPGPRDYYQTVQTSSTSSTSPCRSARLPLSSNIVTRGRAATVCRTDGHDNARYANDRDIVTGDCVRVRDVSISTVSFLCLSLSLPLSLSRLLFNNGTLGGFHLRSLRFEAHKFTPGDSTFFIVSLPCNCRFV